MGDGVSTEIRRTQGYSAPYRAYRAAAAHYSSLLYETAYTMGVFILSN